MKAPPIHKVIVAQLATAVILAAAGFVFLGAVASYSLLLGGLNCALPNAWFAWKAFRYRGARAAQQIVAGFYTGEAGKLLLICAGFALVFIFIDPLDVLLFFAGFIAAQVAGIVAVVRLQTLNSTR